MLNLGLAYLIAVRYNIHGEKNKGDKRESIRINYKDGGKSTRVKKLWEKNREEV